MNFKDRLLLALHLAGKERRDLYKPTGLSIQAVGNVIRGKTDCFSAEYTIRTALYLGISPLWLATGEGPIKEPHQDTCLPLLEALHRLPARKRKAALRLAERLVEIYGTGDLQSIKALHEFLHINNKSHGTDISTATSLPYQHLTGNHDSD